VADRPKCPNCSADNQPGTTICTECGTALLPGDETLWSSETGEHPVGDGAAAPRDGTLIVDDEDDGQPTPASDAGVEVIGAEAIGASTPPAAQAGAVTALAVGTVLGERYRIEQELGVGGMGAVYRARDLELDRDVALKVIKPEFEANEALIQRFKQEIILAREITHRNVVRTFDLGQADGIRFISMEFVKGRELSDVIAERGAMPPDEAIRIIEQICMALDAAHAEGVVHRDLKPQNVMIAADERVVVMDFGIARSLQSSSMTQTGAVMGTPDYMSPEQVKGEAADARSDLFALGVIFYQMLTGELPYTGDTPMAAMFTRTQVRAKPVRDFNPDIPAFLSNVISRCLEISPHKRYQSAREILQDLATFQGGTSQFTVAGTIHALRPTTTAGRSRWRWAGIAAAILAVAALVVAGVAMIRGGPAADDGPAETATVVDPSEVVSLAILPFRNASGDQELSWLGEGLSEMLRSDVGQSATLRSVSGDRLLQVLGDLRLAPGAQVEEVTLRRIAELANADTVVWGQFAGLGDAIRIDATVRDFERHDTQTVSVEAGSEAELLDAVHDLAEQVRNSLALSRSGRRELERQAFVPSSSSIEALRYYNEGVALLRRGDNLEAVANLERAIEADGDFALAHSRLSDAYARLGREQKAVDTARQAVDLSDGLPDAERYQIVARQALLEGEYEVGIDAYQNLLRIHPNDPELHYDLAILYEQYGEFDLAREHLGTAVQADPGNAAAQLAVGRVLIKSGNPQDALAPLNQALSLSIQAENDEAKANTLQALGIAYRYLGQPEEALDNYRESLEIKRAIGDERGTAASLSEIAGLQAQAGEIDAARSSYQEAIDIRRSIGDDRGLGLLLLRLAGLEQAVGNEDDALRLSREALRLQMEIGDEVLQGSTLTTIGTLYDLRGEYSESMLYYERALEIRERLGNPIDVADALHNLAETQLALGRFADAQDLLLRALDRRREAADELGAAYETFSLGRVYAATGRYGAARDAMNESVEAFERLEEQGPWYVEALAGQARVLTLLARFDKAVPILDRAETIAAELDDGMLMAEISLARALGAELRGDGETALERYRAATARAEAVGDPRLQARAEAGTARTLVLAGRTAEGVAALGSVLETAETRGFRDLEAVSTLWLARAGLDSSGGDVVATARDALRAAEDVGDLSLVVQSEWVLAEALAGRGSTDEAARHRTAAARALNEMLAEAGDEPLTGRADLGSIARD
jgi:tetratricopeptide (TPR) repeat protein/predicted Ser/Thr protein kinase/TolB-like protein